VPGDPTSDPLPGIDFSTLVLSLATSAMVHMGLVPETEGGQPEKNLQLAHQTIDTLEMLQHKTRNNLTDDEAKLLQTVLYELRMSYVKARDSKPA
jgi:ABC-type hemin transport system ATPase subunit